MLDVVPEVDTDLQSSSETRRDVQAIELDVEVGIKALKAITIDRDIIYDHVTKDDVNDVVTIYDAIVYVGIVICNIGDVIHGAVLLGVKGVVVVYLNRKVEDSISVESTFAGAIASTYAESKIGESPTSTKMVVSSCSGTNTKATWD